jgi:hypothetical protein
MQACLHVSGEGISSQNFFFKILFLSAPIQVYSPSNQTLSKWELCEETPSPDRSATALRSTSPTRGEVKIPPRSTCDHPWA